MIIALLLALCLALPASAQHDHQGAHEPPAAGASVSAHTANDLQFLAHMIVHHSQAIDMGALVADRTERDELKRFARYIAGAQAAEIVMMSGMLDRAREDGADAPAHGAHAMHAADPPMAGMLSSAEMAALEAASGPAFERLWLAGMIFHHEGGLAMARVQELAQLEHGRRPHGVDVMVQDILDVQRAEVTQMRRWLRDWGLATGDEPDAREPVGEVVIPAPEAALTAGEATTLYGVAVDDRDIAEVWIAIQDLSTEQWLRADESWGEREALAAETVGSGAASAAWRYAWTPPAGRFAVTVEAQDGAGKTGVAAAREISAE